MKAYFDVFKRYKYLLGNLISRDLKVKYRRSALGFLWSILNPLLMMLVVSTVFQHVMKVVSPDITDFAIFYLTGSLIFNFVSESTNLALPSIIMGAPLIKKVYIPKYIFPLEKILFSFVNMLFSLIALVIMLIVRQTPITWTVILFPIPLIYTLIFCIGLGLILATLNVFFRDVAHLYGVFITAWMYLSPVIYSESLLPEQIRPIMHFNPLYHFMTYFRNVVMNGVVPDLKANLICISISVIFFVLGLVVFKKNQDKFILYI
ncbi:MAG: ABC transporter permease [Clostridia bacterium]|nr:ABC transporter permease [Clostridia bacterium]